VNQNGIVKRNYYYYYIIIIIIIIIISLTQHEYKIQHKNKQYKCIYHAIYLKRCLYLTAWRRACPFHMLWRPTGSDPQTYFGVIIIIIVISTNQLTFRIAFRRLCFYTLASRILFVASHSKRYQN